LCRDHGIWSVFSKKRGLNRKPGPPAHYDLVERNFTAGAPNELWLTDITEHPPPRRSSTSARSRTSFPGGSSGTRWTRG
jgi:transposase InsO family protein